jgi:hypothetical protein
MSTVLLCNAVAVWPLAVVLPWVVSELPRHCTSAIIVWLVLYFRVDTLSAGECINTIGV